MENNNSESNTGCIIAVVVMIIIGFVISCNNTSFEEFAEMGKMVLFFVVLAIGYAILSFFSNSSSSNDKSKKDSALSSTTNKPKKEDNETWGCVKTIIIGVLCLMAFEGLYMLVTRNEEFNAAIGVGLLVVIAIVVVIAFIIYARDE